MQTSEMTVRTGLPRRRTSGRGPAFALVGLTIAVLMAASSAPTPLYPVYEQQWALGPVAVTTVFASYAVALLLALVTVGGISDFVGRRPVLAAALLLEAVAMLAFLLADGVSGLVVARVLQGFATGAASGVASAALVDLAPRHAPHLGALVNSAAPTAGLAAGALGSGLLVQFAPAPTTLVFAVLLAAFVLLAALVAGLPETVRSRPGALASLRPRMAVPVAARRTFLLALPVLIATWAMGALYLSLGPSLVLGVLGVRSNLGAASVVALFTGVGSLAAVLARRVAARRLMLGGATALAAGTAVTVAGTHLASLAVFVAGTALAGAGFGTGFLGAFRSVAALATPQVRAELLASVYLVSYVSFSVPALLAGLLVPRLGLARTATGYGAVVVVLALLVVVVEGVRVVAARPRRRTAGCRQCPEAS